MSLRSRHRRPILTGFLAGMLALVSSSTFADPPNPAAGYGEKLTEARSLLAAGKYSDAVKAFKEVDKLANGSCVECRLGLAKAFNKLGAYRDALKNVDSVVGATGEKIQLIQAYNERGIALVEMWKDDPKQLEQAEKAFRQAYELSERKVNPIRFSLAVTLLRLSRDEEGTALLKEYLQQDPNAPSAEIAKAFIKNPLRARKRLIPELELVTLAGSFLTSDDFKGKVLLLDFWGTWCGPCREAVSSLRSLSHRMADEPFVMVSVATDTDEAALRGFIAKEKMTWPQVWDEKHDFTRKCQVDKFPTYMLVSPEGEIVYVVSGWGNGIERELSAKISSAVRTAKKNAKPADKVQ